MTWSSMVVASIFVGVSFDSLSWVQGLEEVTAFG